MDLSLSAEQALIQDTARKFSAAELAPVAGALDGGGGRDKYLSNLKQMAELGLMGLNVSDDFGGTNGRGRAAPDTQGQADRENAHSHAQVDSSVQESARCPYI